MARIPLDDYVSLQQRYIRDPDAAGYMVKYFDLDFYLHRNYRKATRLGLHKSPPLTILDLAGGPGHFSLVCEFLGHRIVSLDIPDDPIVRDLTSIFGLKPCWHRIEPMVTLPDIGNFDLITTFSSGWHRKGERDRFTRAEWEFFLRDAMGHLNPAGVIQLAINPDVGYSGLGPDSPEFPEIVEKFGGTFDPVRRTVRIEQCTALRR